MKTRVWQSLLAAQAQLGKTLFTLTELANLSGAPRLNVNVEMTRLVKYGVIVRHAKGLYGLSDRDVPIEQLLASMDPHAYVTGAYALMRHGLVTQVPTVVTCFTTRRHFRREMQTSAGSFEFVCVKPPVYHSAPTGLADPEQALCDFVYISLRRRQNPTGLLTFRGLERLKRGSLSRTAKRYPATVGRCLTAIAGGLPTSHRS